MREVLPEFLRLASVVLGTAVFLAIIWWMTKAHAHMWRLVSTMHPGKRAASTGSKRLETIVIARHGSLGPAPKCATSYRQFAGAIIQVTESALAFSVVWPFNLACPSFVVAFDQLALQRTSWALWDEPFALRSRNAPGFDIILNRDTVKWIRSHTNRAPFGCD